MCTVLRSIVRARSFSQVLKGLKAKVESIGPSRVSNHKDEKKLAKVVDGIGFSLLQLKPHFLIFALKMMIFFLRNHIAFLRLDHRGLARLQPLEGLGMLFLELPQILLENGVILLELGVFSL